MTAISQRHAPPAAAERTAAEAALFGYPLLLMHRLRSAAPANAFRHERPPAGARQDTVLSSAWLELGAGPMVVCIPPCHGHYYVLSLIDTWGRVFASIGPRTTGTAGAAVGIGGPRRFGDGLPGTRWITAPTDTLLVAVQAAYDHAADGAGARALQDGLRLSGFRSIHVTGDDLQLDMGGAARPLEALPADAWFAELAALLERVPPNGPDRAFAIALRLSGILRGTAPELAAAREHGLRIALDTLRAASACPAAGEPGRWAVHTGAAPGRALRAAAVRAGRFLCSPGDEVAAVVSDDDCGEPLRGENRYRLRFERDQPPPALGLWSLRALPGNDRAGTMIGSGDGLIADHDGSLSIHIQSMAPAERALHANWLPAPRGRFSLRLRLLWPLGEVIERGWSPPAVVRVG